MDEKRRSLRLARVWLITFVIGLILAGLTAIPLEAELEWAKQYVGPDSRIGRAWPAMAAWIARVHSGVTEVRREQPFLFLGTDWLAFGHLAIAILFLGAIWDPARNRWLIRAGMIVCLLVVPWALIFGRLREIPFFWQLIDCAFGVLGLVPLLLANYYARRIAGSYASVG